MRSARWRRNRSIDEPHRDTTRRGAPRHTATQLSATSSNRAIHLVIYSLTLTRRSSSLCSATQRASSQRIVRMGDSLRNLHVLFSAAQCPTVRLRSPQHASTQRDYSRKVTYSFGHLTTPLLAAWRLSASHHESARLISTQCRLTSLAAPLRSTRLHSPLRHSTRLHPYRMAVVVFNNVTKRRRTAPLRAMQLAATQR